MRNPVGVAIDPDDNVYITEYQNHRIQKYAPGYTGWVQTNINGFGEREQGLPTLEVFDGQLYAGTWNFYSGTAQVWRSDGGTSWDDYSPGWSQNNTAVFDLQVFDSYLYAATEEQSSGGEIWRTAGSSWEQVASGGFGDSNNSIVNALTEFDGTLYAATTNNVTGTELWRSSSGNSGDWTQVNADGFGSGGTWQDVSFDVFGGNLYVGFGRNGVAELWRSANGTAWNPVFQNGLGDPDNSIVSALEPFQGELFIGVRNVVTGGQLWRSSNGSDWTLVFSGGLGNSDNGRLYGLIVHGSSLYIVFSNVETGVEVWRSSNGSDWEQDVVEGWGDSKNWYADYVDKGAAVFNGSLYIGVQNRSNGAQIWKMLDESNQIYLPLITRD
jgi:hypothetical protein